jgi:hypothetical protein
VKMCGFSNPAQTISPDDTNVIQSELVSGESENNRVASSSNRKHRNSENGKPVVSWNGF